MAVLHERLNWTRKRAIVIVVAILLVLGGLCALSNSTLANVTVFDKTFLMPLTFGQ